MSFVGVCCTPGVTPDGLQADCEKVGLAQLPISNMLDASGETARAYHVEFGSHNAYTLVVVDHTGKIAFSGVSGFVIVENNAEKYLRHIFTDRCLTKAPGLFGSVPIPKGLMDAACFYSNQRFDLADRELVRLAAVAGDGSKVAPKDVAESPSVLEIMMPKLLAYRKGQLQRLQARSAENPVAALAETKAFVDSTPPSDERQTAQDLVAKLAAHPEVLKQAAAQKAHEKTEAEAKAAFDRIILPLLNASTNAQVFSRKVLPLWDQYVARYGKTDFARDAAKMIEQRRAQLGGR